MYADERGRRVPRGDADEPESRRVLIHAVYLLNCASEDEEIRAKSLDVADRSRCGSGAAIGAARSCCTRARR